MVVVDSVETLTKVNETTLC